MALVLIPALWVLSSNAKTITSTRDHVMAGFMAQRILETMRNYSFDHLDKDTPPAGLDAAGIAGRYAKDNLEYDLSADDAVGDRIAVSEQINNIIYTIVATLRWNWENCGEARRRQVLPTFPSPSNTRD